MIDLRHKPVNTRLSRPAWAASAKALDAYFLKANGRVRTWMYARMYWLENKTAKEIAEHFSVRQNTVEVALHRLK